MCLRHNLYVWIFVGRTTMKRYGKKGLVYWEVINYVEKKQQNIWHFVSLRPEDRPSENEMSIDDLMR